MYEKIHHSLKAQLVMGEFEVNVLCRYILVTQHVKCYDDDMGPYDTVWLVVQKDCLQATVKHCEPESKYKVIQQNVGIRSS